MKFNLPPANRLPALSLLLLIVISSSLLYAQAATRSSPASQCRVESVDYKGWQAQQLSNHWVQLTILPQNGGRVIQVSFGGHPYLFNNPKFLGKYFPPTQAQWFNYGGDKIWLLPEGNNDEQHWPGNSDILDDGPFAFRKISEGQQCEIELTGQPDPQTGVQISRTIRLDSDTPRIRFRANMKNISGHPLEWSMQSVSQYDTSGLNGPTASPPANYNHDFRTFTPVNPSSSYLNRYHVRFGPAENSAVSVRDDGLFTVHYVHMAAELWIDSTAGWLAVVDGNSRYAMVERFQYDATRPYPGKASVIFWTNGRELHLDKDGNPTLGTDPDGANYYTEAELNSPMCQLRPGESCALETEWFPTRAGTEFHGVTDAAILVRPLQATALPDGKVKLSGSFGVLFSGHLVARLYNEHGAFSGTMPVADVDPTELVTLDKELAPAQRAARISLHLEDENGVDRGSLQEIQIAGEDVH